ncbi:MAG TPA: O-antigen ligase family protein [Burkholderiales bacterium]|nr:O-antigen ligase family protein [Burkholderiales bacterium]
MTAARGLAAALGFTLPVSVAADNVLMGLLLVAWLLSGDFRGKWRAVRENPVALAALALFALIALGTLHGIAPWPERFHIVVKYKELLLVPLLVTTFRDPGTRRVGLACFGAAMGVTLAVSLAFGFGLIPHAPWIRGMPDNATVFKLHLTHNILMAFAAYLYALAALDAKLAWQRWALAGLAVLASYDVLFLVQGRTGQMTLLALLTLGFWERLGRRGLPLGLAASAVVAAVAMTSPNFGGKFARGVDEIREWQPGQPTEFSMALRMEFYRNSAAILREHPLLGIGTGSYAAAYRARVDGTGAPITRNPHSEYLTLGVQLGLAGIAALVALFLVQWRTATRLDIPLERDLARGLVLGFVLGSVFNSMLIDHTEGLYFAWLSGLLFAGLGSAPGSGAAGGPPGA